MGLIENFGGSNKNSNDAMPKRTVNSGAATIVIINNNNKTLAAIWSYAPYQANATNSYLPLFSS